MEERSMTKVAIEVAKLLLSAYFSFAKVSGATEEQLKQIYKDARTEFEFNDPNALEEV